MTSATTSPAGAAEREPTASHRPMLLVLLSAVFIAQFDFFVVNVAAPGVGRDLHASSAMLELIVAGYAFAYASGMVTTGRLGDMVGHRRMFILGMAGFGLTSLFCGIATSPGQLVAARLAQGLTGAMMVPQTMGMITTQFPAERRGKALAAWGMAAGVGSIAGQVLGGALVEANVAGLGWRPIFLVNVPVCAVTCLLAARLLPGPMARRQTGLDPLGSLGSSLALALVLVPLTLGRAEGWPLWGWICIAAALLVGAGTLRWQMVLTRRKGTPVIDMTLFGSRSFRAGLIAGTAFQLYFGSFMFTLTLFLQSGLGLDPFQAGLAFCPMGVLFALSSLAGTRLRSRYGPGVLVLAGLVTATGLLLLAARLFVVGPHVGVPWVVFCLCLIGLGNGVVLPSLLGMALMQVRPERAGVANGVLQTAQQFSSSSGVAAVGAVFFSVLGSQPGSHGYATSMAWSAAIDFALIITVTCMVWTFKRLADTR